LKESRRGKEKEEEEERTKILKIKLKIKIETNHIRHPSQNKRSKKGSVSNPSPLTTTFPESA
jgi:hypothetical protein